MVLGRRYSFLEVPSSRVVRNVDNRAPSSGQQGLVLALML